MVAFGMNFLGDDMTAVDIMMSYPLQFVLTMTEKG